MRQLPIKTLPMAAGVAVLLVAGLAVGNALRTDDSPASLETTSVSAGDQQVAPAATRQAPQAEQSSEPPEVTDSMGPDPLYELQYLHEQLVTAHGSLISGTLNAGKLAGGHFVLDEPEILWSASGSNPDTLIIGDQIAAKVPRDTDIAFLGEERSAASTIAAVGEDGKLLAVGMLDSADSFLPTHTPPMLSMGLTLGGEELFRFQYSPSPADPCTPQATPEYQSPLHAIVTYLERLGDQTELATQRTRDEADRFVDDTYANAPSFADAVTGFEVQVSLADIQNQLGRVDRDAVKVRPAIPVEIQLLPEEAAKERAAEVMVFFDQTTADFLGAFYVGTQSGDPTTNEVFTTSILEIAPPEEGGAIDVVVREETGREMFCGTIAEGEKVITIPYGDVAGDTRVSISIASNTYKTVTEFELFK